MHRQAETAEVTAPVRMLTVPEVAVILRCSQSTVKNRIRDGELPSGKIGGLRRVRLPDLVAYIDSRVEQRPEDGAE